MTTSRQSLPAWFFLALLFLVFVLIYGRPVIQNDGITYYALTISLIEDRDFDLTNQHQGFPDLRVIKRADGSIASVYSCGFALLYAPILLLLPNLSWSPYAQNAIFPFSDALAIFTGSVFFGFLCVAAAYKLLRLLYNAPPVATMLIAAGMFIGTPLVFYTFTVPSFAHAADAFLVSISSLVVAQILSGKSDSKIDYALLGLALAFSTMLRNHNIVIALIFTAGVVIFQIRKNKALETLAGIAIGAAPLVIVQLLFNFNQHGGAFSTGYTASAAPNLNQNLSSMLNFIELLINPAVGMFVWSPVTIISFFGLIAGAFQRKPVSILFLVTTCAVALSISFGWTVWPGATFGQRLLTHLYLWWVVGLCEAYLLLKRPVLIAGTVAIIWSFALFNVYYINFAHPPGRKILAEDPANVSPALVVSTAKRTYTESKQRNPVAFWWNSLQAHPYPNVQYILRHPEFQKPVRKKPTRPPR